VKEKERKWRKMWLKEGKAQAQNDFNGEEK